MKVGLYFGSFNPVHMGHLMVAEYMHSHTELEEVWLVVSPQNPFKKKDDLAPEGTRLEMVKLAIAGNPSLKASDVEFKLPQPSYTYNTLEVLTDQFPNHEFSIIMGADNLEFLSNWYRIEDILKQHKVHVYQRGERILESPIKGDFRHHNTPQIDISGTYIRRQIKEGKSVMYLVNDKVAEFISQQKLYL